MKPSQSQNTALPLYALLLLLAYFAAWSFLPQLISGSYPLDVVEGIFWGREWQMGYYKHPPLSSWVLYSAYALLGKSGPYLLSQLCIALTLWLVYRLGKRITDPARAALGSLLLLCVFYFNYPALEFNHNIAQLPVWAGLIYLLHKAVSEHKLRDWLLFGALAGLGMLVKYSVAVLLITAVLYSLLSAHRRLWLSKKPWLALLLALLIFAPHVYWLFSNDWLPFHYTQSRAAEASGAQRLSALTFLLTQAANHLPLMLVLLLTRTKIARPHTDNVSPQNFRFLLALGIGPALLISLLGAGFGIVLRDMWGLPMWTLSALLVSTAIPAHTFPRQQSKLWRTWAIWLLLVSTLTMLYTGFGGQIRQKATRMDWPQQALAAHADQTWQTHSHCRLDTVASHYWLAGTVAAYSQFQPSVLIAGEAAYSPWISPAHLQQHGVLAFWENDDHTALPLIDKLPEQGLLVREGTWQSNWHKVPGKAPLVLQWRAYIPAHCIKNTQP